MAAAKHSVLKRRTEPSKLRDDKIITKAIRVLEGRLRNPGLKIDGSKDACNFLKLNLADLEHEMFVILFLDNRHCLISYEPMFRGTIDATNVYIREIVKRALALNAAALIVAHNHPSGCAEPSVPDKIITDQIDRALSLVGIRLLDHFIVGGSSIVSLEAKPGQIYLRHRQNRDRQNRDRFIYAITYGRLVPGVSDNEGESLCHGWAERFCRIIRTTSCNGGTIAKLSSRKKRIICAILKPCLSLKEYLA